MGWGGLLIYMNLTMVMERRWGWGSYNVGGEVISGVG